MKRFFSILIAVVLVLQLCTCSVFAVNDSGSPKHITRVVSVVFDDSGSMYKNTDRWAYTSYAMQAFSAMMGSEDVLYVTYLNAESDSVEIDLSKGAKQGMIDGIEKTVFGGKTPNKLQQGADCLTKEFAEYGANAQYYLVVMADGDLDPNQGEMADELKTITKNTKNALAGAEFTSIYFSMAGSLSIEGVTSKSAATGNQIVNVLREISADIMGRTEVDFNVSNGKVTFNLKYPALSIALFVQKEKYSFSNVKVPISKDGKSASYEVNTYYVDCPTEIIKNKNHTQYEEKIPSSPPSGFVSLISNGNNSLPKGSYTIDFSAYGISKGNIVVLVEPAVKIGCQYYLNNSKTPLTFDKIKEAVRTGDEVTVKCGLYEINSDGSLGDAVPLDVLSPEYKVYVNDLPVGTKVSGEDNSYKIKIEKDFENKDLKIEAVLKGYQPFVLRENFGQLKIRLGANGPALQTITLTKPQWKNWLEGKASILFSLLQSDASVLNETSIKIEGADFLPSGKCSSLGSVVKSEGNNIVYSPIPLKEISFGKLPANFKISLVDNSDGSVVSAANINVVQPQYKFETVNGLEGVSLGLEMLKSNTKGIKFALTADYDGTGVYEQIKDNECESEIKLALETGALTGSVSENPGEITFTPQYDLTLNEDVSPSEIVGKDHSIFAKATVDGVSVESEKIVLTVGNASYKISVDNPIEAPFTLDTVKDNSQKIVFGVLADYSGNGEFGPVEEWDLAVYEKLSVNTGDLPGSIKTEYDDTGKPIGKSFTPNYDENNNNGVVFTKVAGKTHKIVASLTAYNVSAETTVEVLAPKYEIRVQKEGIKLVDTKLRSNEQGVEFVVLRNERALTKAELENLAPYQLGFSEEQDWMTVEAQAKENEGGAYLFCKPTYDGWSFISPALWSWMCLFKVSKGDMSVILTVGENTGEANIHIEQSVPATIIFWVIIAVLAIIIFFLLCWFTRIKFEKGEFYIVSFSSNGTECTVDSIEMLNANKKGFQSFFKSFFSFKNLRRMKIKSPLFSEQSKYIYVDDGCAKFTSKRDPVDWKNTRSFPHATPDNAEEFEVGHLGHRTVEKIIRNEDEITIGTSAVTGRNIGKSDLKMDYGDYLVRKDTNSIVLFVTKEAKKRALQIDNIN